MSPEDRRTESKMEHEAFSKGIVFQRNRNAAPRRSREIGLNVDAPNVQNSNFFFKGIVFQRNKKAAHQRTNEIGVYDSKSHAYATVDDDSDYSGVNFQ